MAAVTFPNIHCYVLIFLILIRKRVVFFSSFLLCRCQIYSCAPVYLIGFLCIACAGSDNVVSNADRNSGQSHYKSLFFNFYIKVCKTDSRLRMISNQRNWTV